MNFTETSLLALAPRNNEFTVRDKSSPGFALRVRPNGKKSFLYLRTVSGKLQKKTIGTFPDLSLNEAYSSYQLLRAQPSFVPLKSKPNTENTSIHLTDAWRLYEKSQRQTLAPATIEQYGRLIHDLVNRIGDLSLSAVSDGILEDVIFELDEEFSAKGNRMKAAVSSLYKHLKAKRIYLGKNPARGLEYKKEKPKETKLTKRELQAFILALNASSVREEVKAITRLALLTGQRPSELCNIQAEEIDLESGRWVLPSARAKNNREHLIPLSDRAVAELTPYVSARFRGRIFKSDKGESVKPYNVRQALYRIQESANVQRCSLHDLRRTAAHQLNSLGVHSDLIVQLLNHTPQGVTHKHYIQAGLYDGEQAKRDALNVWSTALVSWEL